MSSRTEPLFKNERTGEPLTARIHAGSRVTIVDRFGKEHTGRAVMPCAAGGWVLNMGGKHGTPGIANDANTVKVTP